MRDCHATNRYKSHHQTVNFLCILNSKRYLTRGTYQENFLRINVSRIHCLDKKQYSIKCLIYMPYIVYVTSKVTRTCSVYASAGGRRSQFTSRADIVARRFTGIDVFDVFSYKTIAALYVNCLLHIVLPITHKISSKLLKFLSFVGIRATYFGSNITEQLYRLGPHDTVSQSSSRRGL